MLSRGVRIGIVTGLSLLPMLSAQATNVDDHTLRQRQVFQDAEDALTHGRHREYRRLERKLRDYPLHPYLVYEELRRNLNRRDPETIKHFLDHHTGTPLATRLQYRWLKSLARRHQWQLLIDNFYPTNDDGLRCAYIGALIRTGHKQQAFEVMKPVWLTGHSLPSECDYPIEQWHAAGSLDTALVWERIRLAMQSRHSRLALYLARYLPDNERFWVRLWAKVRRDPSYILKVQQRFDDQDKKVLRWILGDGIHHMARDDAEQASKLWLKWRKQYRFNAEERERIERGLALTLVRDNPDSGQQWLERLDIKTRHPKVLEEHVLSAFKDQDWNAALAWIDEMGEARRHDPRWRYWRGRTLESLGRLDEAHEMYLDIAHDRSYYSFLAADRAGLGYEIHERPVNYSAKDLAHLQKVPAIERARELYALDRVVDARREWGYALKHMNKEQLLMAAQLAHEWDWYDRAIVTFASAQYWDDLEKRFPLAHKQMVIDNAKRQQINPAWAFAIIRQESAFTPDARSRAGALGLMQLLPRTARQLARKLRMRFHRHDLLNAHTNVELGIRYLRRMSDRFKDNKVLATAAYNAGGQRVTQWLPKQGLVPADLWVESVPFRETRNYLKRVLTYTVIYEERLGQRPVPLLERMLPIPGEPTLLSSRHEAETNG
jgi:soluble lytic murein transglycosylase